MLLGTLVRSIVEVGNLTILHQGHKHHFGDGTGAPVTIRLRDRWAVFKLAWDPDFYLGQSYMDGTLSVEIGTIYEFLDIYGRNLAHVKYPGSSLLGALRRMLRRLQQYNPPGIARRNAAHHYDLPPNFYRLFLDADLQYSCAYFREDSLTLEEAQSAKKRLLAAKLLLRPGCSVLDIGCGFGGLDLFLADEMGATVRGITLSAQQCESALQRSAGMGLEDTAAFALADYRAETGRFDRIVSVGMFEHVGVPHYPAFFAKVSELLADDGVAVIHSIGRLGGPSSTDRWTRKYIFPGGYVPALSEVLPVIERSGLLITDIEILRLHYAKTLRCWRERFTANREEALRYGDERFCRMWEFYLAGSEMSFRYGGLMVFQLQLAKKIDTVPLTRSYLDLRSGSATIVEEQPGACDAVSQHSTDIAPAEFGRAAAE